MNTYQCRHVEDYLLNLHVVMEHMNQFYTLLTDFNPNLKFKSRVRNFVDFFFNLYLYLTKESFVISVLLSVIINTDF